VIFQMSGEGGVMDERSRARVACELSTLFRAGSVAGLTDAQLLDRFAAGGGEGEAAFAGIVRRHGPMVLGVCRRALGDVHSAEDAFQATFLVLALRAQAISRRNSLGPWLHVVASRIARRMRALARARLEVSEPSSEAISRDTPDNVTDLRPVLDDELSRLPEKYRLPVILCYLEGLTQQEAARALGWTKGAVSGRLARAKHVLRLRLARRGLAPAAGMSALGTAAGVEAAVIAVPPTLSVATTRSAMAVSLGAPITGAVAGSAIALARGLLRSMLVGRLKVAAVVLISGALGGAVAIGYDSPDDIQPAKATVTAPRSANHSPPQGAGLTLGTTDLRHEGPVAQAVFSPDGNMLATVGWDRAVRLWDPRTGLAAPGVNVLKESARPLAIAFSPDGQLLVLGCEDGTVRMWDLAKQRERFRSRVDQGSVRGIAFAPDGRTFAVVSNYYPRVQIWDAATGLERRTLRFGIEMVEPGPIAFSPDGSRLALGMESRVGGVDSGTIRIWDLNGDSDPLVIRSAHERDLIGLAFANDGRTLISGGSESRDVKDDAGRVKIGFVEFAPHLARWDVRTGRKLWESKPADAVGLGGFALARDGATLVTSHHDGLLVWDIASGRVTKTIPVDPESYGQQAGGVALSPDGRTLALLRHDPRIRLLEFPSGKARFDQRRSHDGRVLSATFSLDARTLATSGDDGKIRVWDTTHGASLGRFDLNVRGWASSVCVSPDGRSIAAVGEYFDTGAHYFHGIGRVWDLSSGRIRRELRFDHRAPLVTFSPDSRRVAISTWNAEAELGMGGKNDGLPENIVRVVDVATGECVVELRGHKGKILAFAFTPNGRSLVTASEDETFRFWALDSGKQTRQFDITGFISDGKHSQIGPAQVAHVAFATDMQRAVTSSKLYDLLIVWDLTSGRPLREIPVEKSPGALLAISRDGRRLGSVSQARDDAHAANSRIQLWDMATGRELRNLPTTGRWISALAISPDATSLATGMADTTTLIWDLGADRQPRRETLKPE
jgi:RNA polymerase sigma factor (sigma-70 family)